jgi:hypothetical protein
MRTKRKRFYATLRLIKLKTAKALGLATSQSPRMRADELIE